MDRRRGAAMRKPALEIDATRTAAAAEIKAGKEEEEEEPVSPTGRLFREPHFSCHIVSVFGLGGAVDLPAVRAGLEASLARHPRFCSLQVLDEQEEDPRPKWVRTTVNIDDHVIVPSLDPTATSADPDRALEDYVSSLSTLPMDHSRPLWELHVLDFPTSEATAAVVLRVHHSVGDGVSLLSLFIACTRRASDQSSLPALPSASAGRRRAGPVYALSSRPRLSPSWDALAAFAAWVVSFLVLLWHTVVDVACFAATATSISSDPPTLFKGAEGVEFRPKRFMNRTLRLDDVKYIKNAVNCTINDVLLGVTSAALSRYYFRKTGESGSETIKVRSTLLVNLRKTPGLHTLATMMESGKDNGAQWGNRLGYMILPFHIAKHSDPLMYVRKATQVARRKKSSMESVFTFWSGSVILKFFGIKAAASLCCGMMRNTTLSFSNVAGPTEQVVFYGHPIVYIAPSVYGHPHALTMHYQSYANIIKLVLAVDETQFPDAHELLDDFDQSLRIIREAASEKQKDT
ncbi:wax ester synthase/diacylglycerol acyltransferase 11-like [Lolium rigidum]|uniref:wax ester synthase/diacylglycerol acyltransferase 11-like n=1 Tax=Lolium rigidum TaxID=89674 RepID=UPI001F5D7A15|nr:wax ester synthase/diacylglycerol acyltransferase 11-like [Lolium rigidum]